MKNLLLILFSCAPITSIIAILFTPLGVISIVALIVTFTATPNIGIIITAIAVTFVTLAIVVAVNGTKELKIKKWVIFLLVLLETIAIWWVFYLYAVHF
ncbi:MAG: hypothetical protein WC499_02995 [Patescibacteria group bacterium]